MLSTFWGSLHAARGLIIMINCQSVQVFEWLVVGENPRLVNLHSYGLVASLLNTLPKWPPYATDQI